MLILIVATHKEIDESEFSGKILPENEFDAKTPPKMRSPVVKMPVNPIPVGCEDEENIVIGDGDYELVDIVLKKKTQKQVVQKPKILTIPVSPFLHTNSYV